MKNAIVCLVIAVVFVYVSAVPALLASPIVNTGDVTSNVDPLSALGGGSTDIKKLTDLYEMGLSATDDLALAAQIPFDVLAASGLDAISWPEQTILQDNSSYDYIVVGGGTAGCVVSRRLAEDRNNSVLVLEAGGNPPISAMIGSLFVLLPESHVDYNFTSTRDDYAARGSNSFTRITAGKMLGGSASLNHLIHIRGPASDYDNWAKLSEDDSWKYENILPYFKKSETVEDEEILSKFGEFHGTRGPTRLKRQPEKENVDLLKSFAEVGNPTVLDLNADISVGIVEPQFLLADYKRQTPAYTYLVPIKKYSNLHVSKNTKVTRIIFKNNVAVAVEAVYNGKIYTIRANKEIIICAGVFNTPQLLMLSGIGPKEHLETFNIKVLKDLPVGDNLVDQVSVSLVYKLKKYLLPIPNIPAVAKDALRFPFPISVGSVALNKSQKYDPDYQTFNSFLSHDTPFLTLTCSSILGLRDEICDRWQKQVKNRDSLYTIAVLLDPKSRGTIRLRSNDPFEDPVIKTGYFSNDEDLEKMLKIVKDYVTVGGTEYFQSIGAKLAGLDLPECAGKEKGSDDFWKCYILEQAVSIFHFASSCSMGKVVDGKLRVKGIKNLRVVDASVMPQIPRAPINAAVLMLAEKASDIIKSAGIY